MEYYSEAKRNEILIHATTQIKLENIMVIEKASHQRPHVMIPYKYIIMCNNDVSLT